LKTNSGVLNTDVMGIVHGDITSYVYYLRENMLQNVSHFSDGEGKAYKL
jgi:hypothetical protein